MKKFLITRFHSFEHALSGWWYVIRTQQNAWIHAFFSIVVLVLSLWLGLAPLEWALIIFAIALVWTAEILNTALEAVVDLASPDLHQLARVGKDVGVAAVLISAISAFFIGILVLGPHLWARIGL